MLDAQFLVGWVKQDKHPSTGLASVSRAERHFLQTDTGQIFTAMSGFAKV